MSRSLNRRYTAVAFNDECPKTCCSRRRSTPCRTLLMVKLCLKLSEGVEPYSRGLRGQRIKPRADKDVPQPKKDQGGHENDG
jgi:hypothetical protein